MVAIDTPHDSDSDNTYNSIDLRTPSIMTEGIALAAKYRIRLSPGCPNQSAGNCFIESIIDQINSRDCFHRKLALSPQYYRVIWMNITESLARCSAYYPGPYDEAAWLNQWTKLRRNSQFDIEYFGDLMMKGVMHCVGKHALIFNINSQAPVNIIRGDQFGAEVDSCTPVILVYNGGHYESLVPVRERDVRRTEVLVKTWSELEKFEVVSEVGERGKKRRLSVNNETPEGSEDEEDPSNRSSSEDYIIDKLGGLTAGYSGPTSRAQSKLTIRQKSNVFSRPSSSYLTDSKVLRAASNISCSTFGLQPPTNRFTVSPDLPLLPEEPLIPEIMNLGISLAAHYFINLRYGTPNNKGGNCSIESVLDQINSRPCFSTRLLNTVQHYRFTWMCETERRARASPFYPGGYTEHEWNKYWSMLRQNGQYEIDYFGDLMMIGIMHCLKKNALIFNTNRDRSHGPLTVIRGDFFGGELDNTIPLVLVYDGGHYESLIPKEEDDVRKTTYIVDMWNSFSGSDMYGHLAGLDWFTQGMGAEKEKDKEEEDDLHKVESDDDTAVREGEGDGEEAADEDVEDVDSMMTPPCDTQEDERDRAVTGTSREMSGMKRPFSPSSVSEEKKERGEGDKDETGRSREISEEAAAVNRERVERWMEEEMRGLKRSLSGSGCSISKRVKDQEGT